jgi:two-component system response regulator RpfG
LRKVADLVLVDYSMPDMDGIEFAKRLCARPGYEHVPVVMVTALDDRRIRYAALGAGITDFLTKPIDARECKARCRNLLTLRRQQIALEDRRRLLEGVVEEAIIEIREREKETLLRRGATPRSSRNTSETKNFSSAESEPMNWVDSSPPTTGIGCMLGAGY